MLSYDSGKRGSRYLLLKLSGYYLVSYNKVKAQLMQLRESGIVGITNSFILLFLWFMGMKQQLCMYI